MEKKHIFNTGETAEELKIKYNSEGSNLRDAQLRMLDMLKYINKVCKEQGISWRLDGGNVLGAVRHGGFIPWDDDVDIALDKKNFNKLRKYLLKYPHKQFVLQDHSTDKFYEVNWCVCRDLNSEYIYNTSSKFRIRDIRKYKGLQIDIFMYQRGRLAVLQFFSLKLRHLIKGFAGRITILADMFFYFQKYCFVPFCEACSTFFGNNKIISPGYALPFDEKIPSSFIFPYKNLTFEEEILPGPNNPEGYCEAAYGDYKNLPPENSRNHHCNDGCIVY